MLRHLADDRAELAGRHVLAVAFLDIPELDEDLRPSLGIGAAIETRELARLDSVIW